MSFTRAQPRLGASSGSLIVPSLDMGQFHNSNMSSTGYPAANLALYVPIVVLSPVLIREAWVASGTLTTSNNVRIGLYAADGTQLFTTPDITVAVASTIVNSAASTDAQIAPGFYLAAFGCDGTRNFQAGALAAGLYESMGCMEQTGLTGAALPSTATFATWTRAFMPAFGFNYSTTNL